MKSFYWAFSLCSFVFSFFSAELNMQEDSSNKLLLILMNIKHHSVTTRIGLYVVNGLQNNNSNNVRMEIPLLRQHQAKIIQKPRTGPFFPWNFKEI